MTEPTAYAARPFRMRPVLLVLLVLVGLWSVPGSGPASASCVGPSLEGARQVLTHDGEQTVTGKFFFDGCEDTGTCSPGCGCHVEDPQSPSQGVILRLRQHGHTWDLTYADADASYDVTWSFELPPDVEPGRARLGAGTAEPIVVRIR